MAIQSIRRRPAIWFLGWSGAGPNPGDDVTRWSVARRLGDAATLHAFEPPPSGQPTLVVADLQRRALVLGSTQTIEVVDHDRAHAHEFDVVRRRSGGSTVLLVPGGHVWVDVWIPASDGLWADDVAAAAVPVGEAWALSLARFGWTGLTVHSAGAEAAPWSDLVCFAGRGPGEVITAEGRKLLGLSQRRTRDWMRMQCLVHRQWNAVEALAGLSLTPDERRTAEISLSEVVAVIGELDEAALIDALLDTLR